MSLPSKAASVLVRHVAAPARQQLPALRASTEVMQKRTRADATDASTSHAMFRSPFHRGTDSHSDTTVIPSFKDYRSGGGETGNKMFQYFMVGAFGGLTALGAKDTVQSRSYLSFGACCYSKERREISS